MGIGAGGQCKRCPVRSHIPLSSALGLESCPNLGWTVRILADRLLGAGLNNIGSICENMVGLMIPRHLQCYQKVSGEDACREEVGRSDHASSNNLGPEPWPQLRDCTSLGSAIIHIYTHISSVQNRMLFCIRRLLLSYPSTQPPGPPNPPWRPQTTAPTTSSV